MNVDMEIKRRDEKIARDKEKILALTEEIIALRQLLDCAAANISLLVKESGTVRKISKNEVREALGKYHLQAKCDKEGNYVLEIIEKENE